MFDPEPRHLHGGVLSCSASIRTCSLSFLAHCCGTFLQLRPPPWISGRKSQQLANWQIETRLSKTLVLERLSTHWGLRATVTNATVVAAPKAATTAPGAANVVAEQTLSDIPRASLTERR